MAAVKVEVKKEAVREFEYKPRVKKRKLPTSKKGKEKAAEEAGGEEAEGETADGEGSQIMSRKRQRTEELMRSLPTLTEWDPTGLPNGFFVVMEGKRRTGKSTFTKWLLQWYQKRFSLVWVMSQTSKSGYWQEFVGNAFVFDSYRADALAKLMTRNDKIIAKYGEDSEITLKTASTLIIFDDCITKDIFLDDLFIRLAVEGRHHCISVIFITQDPKAVCPKVRDNCDVSVVFNQKTFRNKESMWHDFMNDVDKDTALALLSKHAIDHNALVCIQTNLDGVITKNFQVSTGDKTKLQDPHYMLGGPEQVNIILKEREAAKAKKRISKLEEKSDTRPMQDKVDSDAKASSYTVDKILKAPK
jgi:hypothetical protein